MTQSNSQVYLIMEIIIQDTWSEPDDEELIEYVRNNFILHTKTQEQILVLTCENIYKYKCIFADTKIIQKILQDKYDVPICYPDCFTTIYGRKISLMMSDDLTNISKPIFVKPYTNDKDFESKIIKKDSDLESIKLKTKVFVSEICNFVNEYRIFIADKKIFAIVNSGIYFMDKSRPMDIPQDFINKIIELNIYDYIVVDIGFDTKTNKWLIVEVNPPISLDSYGLEIGKYVEFCIGFFNWIKNK
jgi:hypothetical protein